MEVVLAEPAPLTAGVSDVSGVGVVRHEQWRRRGSGGMEHTQIEATHWTAPAHTYGKVVEGVSCVGADGRSLRARRQVEVISARAPGLLQVLKATHTHSHSHSSTSTTFHKNFDDLQLAINPLDVSSQKERLSIGRSGMLSSRRPPSKLRSSTTTTTATMVDTGSTVSKLCHWFDTDPQNQLQSPAIVANRIAEDKSDKRSSSSENTDISDTINDYKTNPSEDSLYDSCPEKESVFKDESEQLEEWRRASKVRRSLQYPCKNGRLGSSTKPLDLPDNWGSVSRIKKELENCQRNSIFTRNLKTTSFSMLNDDTTTNETNIQNDTITETNENDVDNFLIKPSILKKKSFITVDTLNEVRGKLKSMTEQDNYLLAQTHQDLDDGIVAEESSKNEDDHNADGKMSLPSVRSYVFGMESMLNSYNQNKSYSGGTNSLESRVSKLINSMSSRNDDWHARRKSYGFERVQNQRTTGHLLSSHEKNNMESSTDSGICRSSEVVNMFGNYTSPSLQTEVKDTKKANRSTVITLGNMDKKESFETWLMNNRKPMSLGSSNGFKKESITESTKSLTDLDSRMKKCDIQSSNQISISINSEIDKEHKNDLISNSYKPNAMTESLSLKQSEDYALKRHTIAVDAFKVGDYTNDIFEKKNKKVEFCKTEVHFTADSGKVNIVETDGKPPSTNNFRRRRRNSGITPIRDPEKTNLPVTHFGDSLIEKKEFENQNGINEDSAGLKLNYAIITEIKSNTKQSESTEVSDQQHNINGNGDEMSENDQIRGILKNKPVKPKPYHLGEDKTVLAEINASHQSSNAENVWGVKLKPIQDKETPLWCSSVTVKNDVFKDPASTDNDVKEINGMTKSYFGQTEEVISNGQYSYKSENKGYSTKINFGTGEPTVETSYNIKKNNSSSTQGYNGMVKIEPQESVTSKQSVVVSKYLGSTMNSYKSDTINDELKAVQKIKSVMNLEKIPEVKKENSSERDNHGGTTFADQIGTPRSLMPTRGSARKLKDHELSYFGVKVTAEKKTESRRIEQDNKQTKQKPVHKVPDEPRYLKATKENQPFKKNNTFYEAQPIYENVSAVAKKTSSEVTTRNINSGESIIDELTKAADEILQALHDYSDEDSGKLVYHSDKNPQPLSTISETNTWSEKSKTSEHKAVQTILGGTYRYSSLTNKVNGKVRTSSNSSLESLSKEMKTTCSRKKAAPVVVETTPEKPERPQRRKVSSADAVKARRLQRASSRDALMQVHGSSSEDISGHLDVTRKKTVRRSKHNGETTRRSESKTSTESHVRSMERKKESSRSSKYVSSTMPEIRHKTAISTITNLTDRHSSGSKSKSSDRSSKHRESRERIREGTISSLTRDKLTLKDRSRSTDTSLDRENGHSREKSHKREKSREKYKTVENGDKLKRITEEMESDADKKSRHVFDRKSSSGSPVINTSTRVQRGSTRPQERQSTSGRVTNVRTEYDKNLRLI